jgi:hypothetical protein
MRCVHKTGAGSGSCFPLYLHRKLALASFPLTGEEWRTPLARSYGSFCERNGTPGDCLGLFKDGPGLDGEDKRDLALALSVNAALEAREAELRGMFSTTQLWAALSITLIGYMALVAAPEPVSKGVSAALALLMWGYLGWEFFELVRAWFRLWEESAEASTFAELREAGERFGKVIGPNSVRILLLLGTAAVGETAALVSKAPALPGFAKAAGALESHAGIRNVLGGRAGGGQGEGRRSGRHLQCCPARQCCGHDGERAIEVRACPAATDGGPACRDSVQRREERTTCRRLHSVGGRQIRRSGSQRPRAHLRAKRYARYDCGWTQRGCAQE